MDGAGAEGAGDEGREGAAGEAARAAGATGVDEDGAAAGAGAGLDGRGAEGAGAAEAAGADVPPERSSAGNVSLILRTTGGSMVDDADRTNSPWLFKCASSVLLSTPSSLASS